MSVEQVDVPLCPDAEPPRLSLVSPRVSASDCDGCPLAEARYLDDGTPQVCCCGRVYADEDWTWPAERPSCVVDLAPPVRELARAIEDVDEVRRWERAELARVAAGGPAPPSCPIARLMAASDGAALDATPAQVERMRRYLVEGEGKGARETRRLFVAALVDRMERSLPRDEAVVDVERARRHAARLEAMPLEHVRVLYAVARGGTGLGWEAAVRVVVEEVLPRPQVQVWGAAGRPRVDRASVPPEVQREAEGEARLAEAVRAWAEGSGG